MNLKKIYTSRGNIIHFKTFAADDIVKQRNVGLRTEFRATGLRLSHGRRYFFTVTAFNNVGLYTTVNSDGFVVDTDNPSAGIVYNTEKHRNYAFQSSLRKFDLSWHGFLDHYSGIQSYFAALIDESDNTYVTNFTNCGLQTFAKFTKLNLKHGRKYLGAVKAIDAAKHVSEISYSKPKLVDITAPTAYTCRDKSVIYETSQFMQASSGVAFSVNLDISTVYIVSGRILMEKNYPFIRIMIGDKRGENVPVETIHNGAFRFHYNFLSDLTGNHSVSVETGVPTASIQEVAFSKCVVLPVEDTRHALHVTQVSAYMIKTSVRVIDPESSVKRVSICDSFACTCIVVNLSIW